MDNQHRKIAGYRDLTQAEIDAMNAAKAQAEQIGGLMARIEAMPDIDRRALAIACTELQTGFMWLVRAIARPTTF